MLNTITEEVVIEGKSDLGTAARETRGPRPSNIEKQPDADNKGLLEDVI